MGLSQQEIELLVKLKSDAEAGIRKLGQQIDGLAGAGKGAAAPLEDLDRKTEGLGKKSDIAGLAIAGLAVVVGSKLKEALGTCLAEANRLDSGLVGLGATAKAFGVDAGAAQRAAQELAADGLATVGETSAGLKNLLAAGFGLPEATQIMNRFKDTAAFGRQGALGFGQAIVGATEGIKNGNSALVDNVGLTKNLSNILVEAGFSATDLSKSTSDARIRTALFNGILKETNPQLGQTALYLQTAAGKTAQFDSAVVRVQQSIGKQLQPAVAGLLGGLTPLLGLVERSPAVFVALGEAIAAIVIPLAAVKTASTLGVTPALTAMTTAVSGLTGAIVTGGGLKSLGDFRAAIQLSGEASGLTVGSLGKLGSAAAIAAAAFVGWQIGTVIDQMTGASKIFERATNAIFGFKQALADQTAGAVQDVINRAIRDGAEATVSYTEAIKYNTAIAQIRIAVHNKTKEAQLAAIDAELQLGRITTDQANIRKAAVADEEHANDVRAKRVKFSDVLAQSEKAYRDEIAATGLTVGELVSKLKSNETGFEAWAKQVNLSDATVKRLKDTLTEHNKQASKSAETAKKLKDAEEEVASSGDGWRGTLEKIDATLVASVKGYLAAGVSQEALATKYGLTSTQLKAINKSLSEETEQTKKATEAKQKLDEAFQEINSAGDTWRETVRGVNNVLVEMVKHNLEGGVSQEKLALAFGLTSAQIKSIVKSMEDEKRVAEITQRSLDETADLWNEHAALIADRTGTTVDYQIAQVQRWAEKEVEKLKDDDQNWEDHYNAIQAVAEEKMRAIAEANDPFFAAWKDLNRDIRGEMASTWEKVLAGEESWSKAALLPFDNLRSGLLKIFAAILADFQNQLLSPLLNLAHEGIGALLGKLGLGGGASSGGGLGGILGGLLGGGAAGAKLPGVNVGIPAIPGIGAAGGAGGFLASGLGTSLGFGGAGIGSFALGNFLSNRFGKKVGTAGGGLGGAATGALIGSVVPGVGTAIGALVGGLSGVVGGLFGGGNKGRSSVTNFADSFGGLDALHKKLQELGAEGEQLWIKLTQGVGRNDAKGAEAAINLVTDALERQRLKNQETQKAAEEKEAKIATLQAETAARTADVQRQIGDLDKQLADLNASEAPEEFMGVVEQETRAHIDAQRKTLETQLEVIKKDGEAAVAALQDSTTAATATTGESTTDLATRLRELLSKLAESGGVAGSKLANDLLTALDGGLTELEKRARNAQLDIPFRYHQEGPSPGEGGGDDGEIPVRGSAGGGLYSSPTFRVIAESGPEVVGSPNLITRSFMQALKASGVQGGGDGNDAMVREFQLLRRELATLPASLSRSVRDGVLLAGSR
jgi:uncharacterized protein (DUF433 family)